MAIKRIKAESLKPDTEKTAFIVWCVSEYSAQKRITPQKTSELFKKYHVYDFLNMTYEVEKTRDDEMVMKNINKVIKKFSKSLCAS